jgi:hypothetical protein
MNAITKSWRTTALGTIAFLQACGAAAAAALDADPTTTPDVSALITTFTVMLALWMARDNAVSSEAAGTKPQ